jgi:L-seryl-tRNA(Ser) seleniumtransferase
LQDVLRQIPSVDQVLTTAALGPALGATPRPLVVRTIRETLDDLRRDLLARGDAGAAVPGAEEVGRRVAEALAARPRGPRRVLNATGVVLHTNLGRARLAPEAVDALLEVARGASDLEFDLESGRRGSRGRLLERRLVELTGAEAALVVNNNAGALVLALNELAQGREAVVSRGELVEIGGSFRIPDVMSRAGARLVEVGTTNRTHLADYERAIGPDTALLLKVHRSNFRQEGFVTEPGLEELVALGRSRGVPVLHDLGSGALVGTPATEHEPGPLESLRADVDVLTMSGDKLLGGPQAGILLGKRAMLDRLRKNPLARALRVDKFTIAALAATLDLLEDPDQARERLPVLRALSAPASEMERRARELAEALEGAGGLSTEVVPTRGEVGGGAVPGEGIPSFACALRHASASATELARVLRGLPLPVIGRIEDERVLLDPRSLDPSEDDECVRTIRTRFGGSGGE